MIMKGVAIAAGDVVVVEPAAELNLDAKEPASQCLLLLLPPAPLLLSVLYARGFLGLPRLRVGRSDTCVGRRRCLCHCQQRPRHYTCRAAARSRVSAAVLVPSIREGW